MGISRDWCVLWNEEDTDGVFTKKDIVPHNVQSVFIDGQIKLMQSFIKDGSSWNDFVNYTFNALVQRQHEKYDTVVLAFDNYMSVPLYKSIEQQRRINPKFTFKFETGQELPSKPPAQDIWTSALQNRNFKTTVICIICNLIASSYQPRHNGKTLIIDFVNVIRIEYTVKNNILVHKNRQTMDAFQVLLVFFVCVDRGNFQVFSM